jgi:hypothetical protein
MKNSKIILAGSTLVLAIAGAFVSKAAKTQKQLTPWSCNAGNALCSHSHAVLNSATVLGNGAVYTLGNFTVAHTCVAKGDACGAAIRSRGASHDN